ncbi:hypothetical protein GCM10018987_41470 [Streptomyces cremeus]
MDRVAAGFDELGTGLRFVARQYGHGDMVADGGGAAGGRGGPRGAWLLAGVARPVRALRQGAAPGRARAGMTFAGGAQPMPEARDGTRAGREREEPPPCPPSPQALGFA